MGLTMRERKAVIKQTATRYRRSKKKQRGKILDEFVETTGYNRKYAGWILRNWGMKRYIRVEGELIEMVIGTPRKKKRRARPRTYGPEVLKALKKIWYIFDCPCGKRLVPILRSMLPVLEKFDEIPRDKVVQEKLVSVSSATVDRLLQAEKRRLRLRGRSHTRPASLFKNQIPIRTFGDWKNKQPGFTQLDLVGHDGGVTSGDFAFTLNLTDVNTGWTEPRGILNKAQKWTVQAIDEVRTLLPFELLGIHSDSGSEFINAHLLRYCQKHHTEFTRSRPSRKNDNCFIEQKNDMVVRRYVGYMHYEGEQQVALLNELYDQLRLFVNFFQPSMKLIEKVRQGSKVTKRYDVPKTPYQRVLDSEHIHTFVKEKLRRQFEELNPAELHRRINALQARLWASVRQNTTQPVGAVL